MYSYGRILRGIVEWMRSSLPHQVLDQGQWADGAFIAHGRCLWEVAGYPAPDVSNQAHAVACAAYSFLADGSPHRGDQELFDRTARAIRFLRRAQRPTGLLDLPSTNYESPPDTAFAIQLLAPAVALARRVGTGDERAQRIADALGEFVRAAAEGIVGRGFHTPNHRWVICGALAQAMALHPDLDAREYVESILAEGIDCNEDGEFTERSAVVYNAVCDRSLRFLADHFHRPDLLDHVRRNLDLMLHLLHPDATAVTSISVREDRGRHIVPYSIADSFFDMAQRDGNGVWASAADTILAGEFWSPDVEWPFDPFVAWLFEPFVSHSEYRREKLERRPLPDRFTIVYPAARMWRVRRGLLSATAVAGHRIPFALRYGDVNLKALKLFGSYILAARFEGDEFERIDGGVRMVHRGALRKLPGYDLPLGRPVPFGRFGEAGGERKRWTQPPMDIVLDVREVTGGFDLSIRTVGGMDRILFQIECCFDGPGEWETDDQVIPVTDGQTAILKHGHGIFHRGRHGIKIGPGSIAHRVYAMRNSEPEPDSFRVLVTLETPVDHTFEVRYGAWSAATGGLVGGDAAQALIDPSPPT